MDKLVYISGPYTAPTSEGIQANIIKAVTAAMWCAENGIYYFCPHMNSAFMHEYAPSVEYAFWIEMDLFIAWKCNAILLLEGWEESRGAQRERNSVVWEQVFLFPQQKADIIAWKESLKRCSS